jgi:hypothetical protein
MKISHVQIGSNNRKLCVTYDGVGETCVFRAGFTLIRPQDLARTLAMTTRTLPTAPSTRLSSFCITKTGTLPNNSDARQTFFMNSISLCLGPVQTGENVEDTRFSERWLRKVPSSGL